MTIKAGLNKMDIKRYHRLLEEEVPVKVIARKLSTTVGVLNRLSPKRIADWDKKKKLREEEVKRKHQENMTKANVLAQTAANVLNDIEPDE